MNTMTMITESKSKLSHAELPLEVIGLDILTYGSIRNLFQDFANEGHNIEIVKTRNGNIWVKLDSKSKITVNKAIDKILKILAIK